jgi:two-component system NtrC family response regulator
VGELPLLLQVKLLRFLQERQVERVGGRGPVPVTARVIAATNRELKREIAEGRFREDLYYRLGVVNLVAPPLRDRGDDIVVLANHFLKSFSGQYQKAIRGFGADALAAMKSYSCTF